MPDILDVSDCSTILVEIANKFDIDIFDCISGRTLTLIKQSVVAKTDPFSPFHIYIISLYMKSSGSFTVTLTKHTAHFKDILASCEILEVETVSQLTTILVKTIKEYKSKIDYANRI